MAGRRYYSDTDRTRRAGGALLVVVGLSILALLLRLAMDGVSTALVLLAVVPLLLIGIGARFLSHVVAAFDIDLDQRRYSLVRNGKPAGGGALDELGPLRVVREQTTVESSGSDGASSRTHVRFKVKPAGFGFFSFDSLKSPRRARRRMEELARRWRLSCRSLDGPVRPFDHLDAPLHERLRNDAAARTPAELDPEWRISITPIFRGHAVTSRHRSFEPLWDNAVYAFLPVAVLFTTGGNPVSAAREMVHDPFGRVLLGLAGVVAGVMAWKLSFALLDTFRPGTIAIDDHGVAYRWSRMKFDRIEEVTTGQRIEIAGDRKVLALPVSFCPHEAKTRVAHELQRLILEAATRRGLV